MLTPSGEKRHSLCQRRGCFMSDRSRRVLIVVQNLPVPPDRRVWMSATTLAAHGHVVSVISPMGQGHDAPYECLDGVHVYRHPAPPEAHEGMGAYIREYVHSMRHWFRLAALVRRERGFDVLHGCNPPDLVFLLAWRYRLAGVRFLFDHHDVNPELYEAKFGRRGPVYRILRLLERLTFASARVSLATNDSFRRIALERGRMAPADVFTVRSAPRRDVFKPVGPNPALRGRASTILGYVGVIGQQEGMELLIEALDILLRKIGLVDFHAVIVGFGSHLSAVRAEVSARGLEQHVTFTGALFGDDLISALSACDIGVSPDPRNAMNDISTMNKVVEYMALGLPVVQFDLVEGRASAGSAALYARPNDPEDFARQIARLAQNPQLRKEMGAEGRRRVERELSWEHSAPQLLAAYRRLFGDRP